MLYFDVKKLAYQAVLDCYAEACPNKYTGKTISIFTDNESDIEKIVKIVDLLKNIIKIEVYVCLDLDSNQEIAKSMILENINKNCIGIGIYSDSNISDLVQIIPDKYDILGLKPTALTNFMTFLNTQSETQESVFPVIDYCRFEYYFDAGYLKNVLDARVVIVYGNNLLSALMFAELLIKKGPSVGDSIYHIDFTSEVPDYVDERDIVIDLHDHINDEILAYTEATSILTNLCILNKDNT